MGTGQEGARTETTGAGMLRRDFVRRLPVVTAGLAAGLSGTLAGCAGTPYVAPTTAPGGLSIPTDALSEGGDAFVQAPGMDRPIYVHRSESGEWTAVLASCTHRGCQPEPLADRLVCPCHGSEFSRTGEVLAGPAERALTRYDVVEEGDRVIVRIDGRES